MFGSSVVPDLLDTMKIVFARSTLFSMAFTCAGSVESSTNNCGIPVDLAESLLQNFGTQAGSAHAEQQRVLESGRFHIFGDVFQMLLVRQLIFGNAEPAEPLFSSVPVHSDASRAHKRRTLPAIFQSSMSSESFAPILSGSVKVCASTSACGNELAFRVHRVQQLVERLGEQLHGLGHQIVGDLLHRNASLGQRCPWWPCAASRSASRLAFGLP